MIDKKALIFLWPNQSSRGHNFDEFLFKDFEKNYLRCINQNPVKFVSDYNVLPDLKNKIDIVKLNPVDVNSSKLHSGLKLVEFNGFIWTTARVTKASEPIQVKKSQSNPLIHQQSFSGG